MGETTGALSSQTPLRNIAVLGAGLMGHAIAFAFASYDLPVRVFDRSQIALDELDGRLDACATATGKKYRAVGRSTDIDEIVADADIVFEAVPERLDLKIDVLGTAHRANATAILATNTSVIPIADIEAGLPSTASLVGTHWWNPAHLIRIIEVVPGDRTNSTVLEVVMRLLTAVGKTPVTVRDAPGFVGNRLQFALWREAMHIVETGIADAETVDLIARETFGLRLPALGPLENADYIGLELTQQIMSYVLPHLSVTTTPPPVLTDLLSRGHTGNRTGAGFLDWPAGRATDVRERLDRQLGAAHTDPGYSQ